LDANHASQAHHHSISGYTFLIRGGAVSWSSKKQSIVVLSTTEAEYIATTHTTKEAMWLHMFVGEIMTLFTTTMTLLCDNQSAIAVSKNPEHHGKMKHLSLHLFWLRDAVEDNVISPKFVDTRNMAADIFTKALDRFKVQKCARMLGLE